MAIAAWRTLRDLTGAAVLAASLGLLAAVPAAAGNPTSQSQERLPGPDSAPVGGSVSSRDAVVIYVFGERLSTSRHDTRNQAIEQGFANLNGAADCQRQACAVGYYRGDSGQWVVTTVYAGTRDEVLERFDRSEGSGMSVILSMPGGSVMPKAELATSTAGQPSVSRRPD